jgi:hypothetical protein
VTDAQLTVKLAVEVLGWKTAPGRFVKPGRSWTPSWRFAPLENIAQAFELLDAAAAAYKLSGDTDGRFMAEVHIGSEVGKAYGPQKARVICLAVARAIGADAEAQV